MAIICTDFLLGSDTTGNGSSTTPYKTIAKAFTVAIDNDEIRVAGNGFTQMSGTGAVTVRGTTITTSVDLTGSIAVGDTIGLEADTAHGFGYDKTLFVVSAITATTITIASTIYTASGTYNIWKFNGYHYTTAVTTPTQEPITSVAASILSVSGGWNSTFDTQIGMTGIRYTGGGAGGSGNAFTNWQNVIKPTIVFDKFMCVNTAFVNGSGNSIGINNITFVRSTATFGTSNSGVYPPTTGGTVNIVACDTTMTTSWNDASNRPASLNINQIISGGTNTITAKIGYALGFGNAIAPMIKSLNVKVRTCNSGTGNATWAVLGQGTQGDVYIDSLNLYLCGQAITPLLASSALNDNAWRYIGDLNVTRLDTTNCGIRPLYNINTITPVNINRTSGPLEALPWLYYGSPEAYETFLRAGSTIIYGKDTEGYKIVNNDSIPKYADPSTFVTGSNSLRLKVITNTSGVDNLHYLCATMVKPNTNFTLTIKAKATKNITTTSTKLLYGPAYTQEVLLSAISLTTSFQDFTFNITPASYANWSFGDDGLMGIFLRVPSVSGDLTTNDYIWIDSVTVS